MKIHYIILIIIALSLIVGLVVKHMTRDKSDEKISATEMMNERKQFTEQDGKEAIAYIQTKYGKDTAKLIERMLRLETAHFKSGQYKLTGSAGMEVGKWAEIPNGATDGFIEMEDNHDHHIGKFIVWHSVKDFAEYLVNYIKRHDGNYARWNTTNPTGQIEYRKRVNEITPRFVA